jgi:hypothetical protein
VLAVLGLPVRWVVALNAVFWLWVAWDACKRLVERPWDAFGGWLAAVASGLCWWSADHGGFDLAVAGASLQALAWLHQSRGLKGRRESLIFGAWLGVAFLTKYSSPLVLVLPVLAGGLLVLKERSFKNLGLSLGVWVLVAGLWLGSNHTAVMDYVASALNPPVAPGNFPVQRSFLERFAGEGQGMFVAVLKDAFGWPLLLVLGFGAVIGRRWLLLSGVASGVLLLGAMNSREGRYALPMVFFLAAAGAPIRAGGWQQRALLLLALLPGLYGTASTFAATTTVPSRRPLEHSIASLKNIAPWPTPATPFLPVSEHPDDWKIPELRQALAGESLIGVLIDGLPEAPGSSVYQLSFEEAEAGIDIVTIHALVTDRGLETNSYRGPLSVPSEPPPQGSLRREPASLKLVYVVTHPSTQAGRRWLQESSHTVLQTFKLPSDHTGVLVKLKAGQAPPPPESGPPDETLAQSLKEIPDLPGSGPVFFWPPPLDSGPALRFAARTGRKISVTGDRQIPAEIQALVEKPLWRLGELQKALQNAGWEQLYVDKQATYGQAPELKWLTGDGTIAVSWPDVDLQRFAWTTRTTVPVLPDEAGNPELQSKGLENLLDRSLSSQALTEAVVYTSPDGMAWTESGWIAHSLTSLGLSQGPDQTLILTAMVSLPKDLSRQLPPFHSSAVVTFSSSDLQSWTASRWWLADRLSIVDPQLSFEENVPVLRAWVRTGPLGVDPVSLSGEHPIVVARLQKDGQLHAEAPQKGLPFLADPSPAGEFLYATLFPFTGIPRIWIGKAGVEVGSLMGLTVPFVWQHQGRWRMVAHGPGKNGLSAVRAFSEDGIHWSQVEVLSGFEEIARCESPVEGFFKGQYVLICSRRLKDARQIEEAPQ